MKGFNASLPEPPARVHVKPSNDQKLIDLLMIGHGDKAFTSFSAEFESQVPNPWQGEIERVTPGWYQRGGPADKTYKSESQAKSCPAEMQETFALKGGNVV